MGKFSKVKNIMVRINGTSNSKPCFAFSHDSAPHSYHMVQGCRLRSGNNIRKCSCFLYTKKPHKNDIIIPFSDAEELGLNGAALLHNTIGQKKGLCT
jgi:hypothetical protein